MSAAAARRKKQLAARAANADGDKDIVIDQLEKLMNDSSSTSLSEEVAYEALQLAQSSIRKRIQQEKFSEGCDLAYHTSLQLLQKGRVSVASQLLQLLVDILRETHTIETETWVNRIVELHNAHQQAMENTASELAPIEANRLQRLQRSWLLLVMKWSSDLGTIKYGHQKIHELLGLHCWKISKLDHQDDTSNIVSLVDNDLEVDVVVKEQCDAVQYMALAEKPDIIAQWLRTLPKPTPEQISMGHECPPAIRDMLLTRAVLLFCAVENLRDANILVRAYMDTIEERPVSDLAKSYTSKEDGFAPSHLMFCTMLVRICEKDSRTGPLFQWLLKSFKRELDGFHYKPQAVQAYHTKIGKIYFGIEPPPSMLRMMEGMLGGGGLGGGGFGGIDPAMMQAALAQMQR